MGNQSSRIIDLLLRALDNISQEDFKRFKDSLLHSDFKGRGNISRCRLENADRIDTKNLLLEFYGRHAAADVTIEVFTQINLRDAAAKLREEKEKDMDLKPKSGVNVIPEKDYRVKYRERILKQYQLMRDRNARLGEMVGLNNRYTKLMIVTQYRPDKEREHEIIAMGQTHSKIMNKHAHCAVTVDRLFKKDNGGRTPQTVVLLGAAGIGKTMTVKKIVLDWAAGKLYKKKFHYVFYINCREMNFIPKQGSLADIILKSCPNKNAPIEHILANPEKLLFIIDGFDELRFSLDQPESDLCFDPWEKQPAEIILNSLFRRTVLPGSYLIIITRPVALEKLKQSLQCALYTEILGFSEEDREEYFYRFFGNEKQASEAFNFVRENEILFTMCFVPIVCWIICTVLKQQMERGEDLLQTSKTVTGVYMLFLFSLVDSSSSNSRLQIQAHMRRLCSLAADGMWEQKILFEQNDIKRFEDHKEEKFQRLSKQLRQEQQKQSPIYLLCQALKAPNCKLEKLNLWSCKLTVACCEDLTDVLRRNDSLRELQLGDNALGDSGARVLCEGANHAKLERLGLWRCNLTGACCGDLSAVLSTKQSLTELELGHNDVGDSGVRWLCEGLKHPNCKLQRLRLWWCQLTASCCGDLAAVLRSNQSLAELELGGNEHLGDAGVQQLCEGLKHPNCKLQKLGLSGCDLTAGCCRELSSVLSTSQTLTELNLRDNQLGHSGVQLLCEGLQHPDCKLRRLRLSSHTFKEETRTELGAVREIKAHLVIESN
ncbi:ribonuclease inhibitor-like [Alligator mississippiensis]|uniref:NACHT, LRR and PYD domains-containing protein 3 n=1 Tax=Alligator mississippiensis TaxID=8496 RepID=A0A151NXK2_ALLMI|nr:ribonuclease inhibitor-like [Alligator mississippiensis]